jgi:hypothetical protein
MIPEVFADTFGRVDFIGGAIRIELIAIDPGAPNEADQLQMTPRQRVIMPVDGFLHAYGTMSALVDQLAKSGAIKGPASSLPPPPVPRRTRRARPTSADGVTPDDKRRPG